VGTDGCQSSLVGRCVRPVRVGQKQCDRFGRRSRVLAARLARWRGNFSGVPSGRPPGGVVMSSPPRVVGFFFPKVTAGGGFSNIFRHRHCRHISVAVTYVLTRADPITPKLSIRVTLLIPAL
jgi:hypothetical protein